MHLEVYDPPMCCTRGACGPTVDPALTRFAAALEAIKQQGVPVTRCNLSHDPMAFDRDTTMRTALQADNALNHLPEALRPQPTDPENLSKRFVIAGYATRL